MSGHILGPILKTLEQHTRMARLRTQGGVLNREDMAGIFGRVGKIPGCTPRMRNVGMTNATA